MRTRPEAGQRLRGAAVRFMGSLRMAVILSAVLMDGKLSCRLWPILLVLALLGRAAAQDATNNQVSAPAPPQNTAYNPDPGATKKTVEPPFYQVPPGTPPDYQSQRDPLLDEPHEPVVPLPQSNNYFQNRSYPLDEKLPPNTQGVPDRWDLDIPVFMRYNQPEHEEPYMYGTPELWDPYKQSLLKGDVPIIGQDIFLTLRATSFTSYEARDLPTPSGVSTAGAGRSQFFGDGDQQEIDQFLTFSIDLFKGETVFQPLTMDLHLEPVYNVNYTRVRQNGILSVDPRGSNSQSDNNGALTNNSGTSYSSNGGVPGSLAPGSLVPGNPSGLIPGNPGAGGGFQYIGPAQLGGQYVTRTKDFISLQSAFLEFHLSDLSNNYDFLSLRMGNQPFNSDFRGFVFNDTNLGIRLFGNYDSNRLQFNAAVFAMREKDTYSELNTFDSRHQYVFIANVYRQDFFAKGYTAQLSFLANLDNADTHFDRTDELVDPAPIGGPIVPHDIRAYYLGWNGDGHIGRLNLTHSFYEVLGTDTENGIAGRSVSINAQMAAAELSYDQDWIRFKASVFYGSGDQNPEGSHATGFDTILDNPNFVGGPFSYFVRQGFIFGDTSVDFKQRNSLVIDLRTSKDEGQANFVNPGVLIYGIGTDMDLLPTLKLFLNANYVRMVDTQTVNFALHTANVTPEVGWDLSGGIEYRPLLTNNIIISAGIGALIPGDGYRAIYENNTISVPGYDNQPAAHLDSFLYSAFAALTLTY